MATALVTGAARGIGRATAAKLVAAGYEVVIADLDVAAAKASASELGALAIELDVTDEASVLRCVAQVPELDVLVNNAGLYRRGTLADVTVADYRLVLDVNLLGPLLMTRHFADALAAGGGGAVVNVASMSGISVVPELGSIRWQRLR